MEAKQRKELASLVNDVFEVVFMFLTGAGICLGLLYLLVRFIKLSWNA